MSALTEFYALRLAPLALLAVAACSSPAGAEAPDASPPDADAAAGSVRSYGEGRVTVGADGVAFDTTLGVACAFSAASDGVVRCLPAQEGVASVGFTSVDCTGVVVSAPQGTERVYFLDGAEVCQSDAPFRASAVLTASDGGGCNAQTSLPEGLYFRCSSTITASQFVALTDADQ